MHESYVEILDRQSGQRVVTVVEVLSPTNKFPGPGQASYLAKQREVGRDAVGYGGVGGRFWSAAMLAALQDTAPQGIASERSSPHSSTVTAGSGRSPAGSGGG